MSVIVFLVAVPFLFAAILLALIYWPDGDDDWKGKP